MNLISCFFIFNHVRTWMLLGAISYSLPQALCIKHWYWFRKREFSSHEDRHSNFISGYIWIRWYDTSTSIIYSFTHHFHSEHAFFFLQKLSDPTLFLISSFWCHWWIHKTIYSFLELDPFLSCNPKFASFLSLGLIWRFILIKQCILHCFISLHNF